MGTLWNLQSQFLVAIQNGDVTRVHDLLEKGVDPDMRFLIGNQKRPAVCLCVEKDNVELLKLLLQSGCSINQCDASGLTALHIAANHSCERIVGLLLEYRGNVNAVTLQGDTPLHLAAQRHSVDVVRMLVEAGAEVNRRDHNHKTPLMNACIHGRYDIANYLIQQHAELNVPDPCGHTPLLFVTSAMTLDIRLLSSILDAGANVDNRDCFGKTALHLTLRGSICTPNRLHALDLLLAHGCDANAQTDLGHTPLHLAVLERDVAAIVTLVQAGCDVDIRDKLGLTPLFYLVKDGNLEMVKLLLAAGAQVHRQAWLQDLSLTATVKDRALVEYLVARRHKVLTLKKVCRQTLRVAWGRDTNCVVDSLSIPVPLKHYLKFKAL